jgi:hypothetical protein
VFKRADRIHLAFAPSRPPLGVLGDLGGFIRIPCIGCAPAETARKIDADYEEVKKMLAGLFARVSGRSAKL